MSSRCPPSPALAGVWGEGEGEGGLSRSGGGAEGLPVPWTSGVRELVL